jgi:pyruvate-formate lyase
MEEISELKYKINNFLEYSTNYILDLQEQIRLLTESNNRLKRENDLLKMTFKYKKKKS